MGNRCCPAELINVNELTFGISMNALKHLYRGIAAIFPTPQVSAVPNGECDA